MARLTVIVLSIVYLMLGSAAAQDHYPSKPIRIILPYGAGSATDIITRIMCEQLRQILGQSCVVDNKPGAFGILAIEEMARARPDGYTLQVGNVSTNAITPVLFAQKFTINYEKDVVPVARLADVPSFFIATTKDFPPRSVAEFIAYAQQNPGKIRYASPGVGSFPHFDMELLAKQNGLSMVHIPIKAGPPGYINEMVGGDIHVATINVATATPMVKAGQLRALAVNSEQRLPAYPDVPTIAEAGYPGIMTVLWAGLFAPAATPRDVLATLQQAVVQALNSPPVQEAYERQIIRSGPTKSLADANSWLANEIAIWKKKMREVKIDLTD